MKRCTIGLTTLTLGLLLAAVAADAQPAKQIPRIGFLASSGDPAKGRLAAFQQALRALGYVEGKNIVIEQRYAAGEFERLPNLAAELVRLNVDVILAEGPRQPMRRSGSPPRFRSSSGMRLIRLGPDLSPASPGRAETLPGCRISTSVW